MQDKIKAYIQLGVEIEENVSNKETNGTCPFCGRENRFYINQIDGRYHCKSCESKGNLYTFLRELHLQSEKETTDTELAWLAEHRGLKVSTLRAWRVACSYLTGEPLIPTWSGRGKLVNLYRYVELRDKWMVLGTASMKPFTFRQRPVPGHETELWIVEGPWDGMALWEALASLKRKANGRYVRTVQKEDSLLAEVNVIAVPGCGVWDAAWCWLVKGRTVTIAFDNDHPRRLRTGKISQPGWVGTQRTAKLLIESDEPDFVYWLKWGQEGYDSTKTNGYDIRDILRDEGSVRGYSILKNLCEKAEPEGIVHSGEDVSDIRPIERDSFAVLCKDYKSVLHFTSELQDTLAVMLATVISTELEGDQLWLRVIGPPGSGKSTLAEAISVAKPYIFARSMLTGFHSGFIGAKGSKDSSLIPEMDRKTVIIKDADTLLTSPHRDTLLAELRDIYDGTSRSQYRNRKTSIFEGLRITFILCGTDALRALNRAFLGERFLDVEILGNADPKPYLDQATDNTYIQVISGLNSGSSTSTYAERLLILKQATYGYIIHMKENLSSFAPPKLSIKMRTRIKALGTFLSYVRARVDRDKDGILSRPRAELATRIVSQLVKLSICLALIFERTIIDDEVFRVVRKVVKDTAESFQYEVTCLLGKYKEGMTQFQLSLELALSSSTVSRILNDMMELKMIKKSRGITQGMGRPVITYRLSKILRVAWLKGME